MGERAPLQPLLHFIAPEFLLAFLIATRRGQNNIVWRFLGFALYVYLNVHAISFTTGEAAADYGIGSFFAVNVFTATHFLWLTDPLNDFYHENDRTPPKHMSFSHRLYWAACLRWNLRGIGWNCQNKRVSPSLNQSRWTFVLSALLRILGYGLLTDLAQTYIHSNPFFALRGADARPILDQGHFFGTLNLIAYWTSAYTVLSMQYYLIAVAAVSLGVSDPKYWPDFFGQWSDAYTIRRFWSRTWHQSLCRFVTSIGKFFARSFGFTPGSWGSSCTQLYAAFTVSGVVHCTLGDAMVDPKYIGASFPFFFLQAVAITLEDVIIKLAGKAGLTQSTPLVRSIGYVWVATWFYLTLPGVSWIVGSGLGLAKAAPFSLIRQVVTVDDIHVQWQI